MKSIPESFQSASPQIWKCCFISDFEMLDPLLIEITKTLNFKHDHLKTVGLHNCFQTIFYHFKYERLNTEFQSILDIKLTYL